MGTAGWLLSGRTQLFKPNTFAKMIEMKMYQDLEKILHEKNKLTELLEILEKKTNVPRTYLVIGFAACTALYLMCASGYGANFVCNLIGFLYPAYQSVLAIESNSKDDDTKWLTYWVVYSAFSLMEFFTDIFLWWIPFYWFFKVMFLLYCMLPGQYNGSMMVYTYILKPFIQKHKSKLEKVGDMVGDMATDAMNEVQDALVDHVANHVKDSSKTESDC